MNFCKMCFVLVPVFAFATGLSTVSAQQEKGGEKSNLPKCPVMDDPVDLAVSIETDEGPVYFCCLDCIEKYKKNPQKYAQKAAKQRKVLASRPKVQVTCPITGKGIDPKVHTQHEGKEVFFCCNGCIPKFKNDPSKYSNSLADSYTYQTKCPVMGGEINPQSFTKLVNGRKIYFCCPGCDKKLRKNPAKYLPNLHAQGYFIDAEMLSGKSDKKGEAKGGHEDHEHGHEGH